GVIGRRAEHDAELAERLPRRIQVELGGEFLEDLGGAAARLRVDREERGLGQDPREGRGGGLGRRQLTGGKQRYESGQQGAAERHPEVGEAARGRGARRGRERGSGHGEASWQVVDSRAVDGGRTSTSRQVS